MEASDLPRLELLMAAEAQRQRIALTSIRSWPLTPELEKHKKSIFRNAGEWVANSQRISRPRNCPRLVSRRPTFHHRRKLEVLRFDHIGFHVRCADLLEQISKSCVPLVTSLLISLTAKNDFSSRRPRKLPVNRSAPILESVGYAEQLKHAHEAKMKKDAKGQNRQRHRNRTKLLHGLGQLSIELDGESR